MNRFLKNIYLIILYSFLYLPLVIMAIYSFNNSKSSSLWHGFTLKWYFTLFQDTEIIISMLHSILVALVSSTLSCIIGFSASILLLRYRFFGKSTLQFIFFLMILIPDILLAISLLLLYHFLHIPLGFVSLTLAHITLSTPLVTLLMYRNMKTLDRYLFEAAYDLGATYVQIITRLILPLLRPALFSSFLIALIISLDDLIISFFVSGPEFSVLPVHLYSMMRIGISPEIHALSTVLVIMAIAVTFLSRTLIEKKR